MSTILPLDYGVQLKPLAASASLIEMLGLSKPT